MTSGTNDDSYESVRVRCEYRRTGNVQVLVFASDRDGRHVAKINFASALACALKAKNLVYLTDIAGVQDKYNKRIPVLKIKDIDGLIDDKTIQGGMIPKVQSARAAILKGVGEINIVDGYRGIEPRSGTTICR